MNFRTIVDIPRPNFLIEPLEEMLFVGSCFADNMGKRFAEERFPVVVNPFGVMYNPVSVRHTIERWTAQRVEKGGVVPRIVVVTLGTNHVYWLKETGQVVDNCRKMPQQLFREEELTAEACVEELSKAVTLLCRHRVDVQVMVTVSPIRYAKYGYHASQLSKAVLLLTADKLCRRHDNVTYFPAYEIVMDELRDYRFYQPDMLHPSAQAVEFIWEQLTETYLSARAKQFLRDWKPVKEALQHRPFHLESDDYQRFLAQTKQREADVLRAYI